LALSACSSAVGEASNDESAAEAGEEGSDAGDANSGTSESSASAGDGDGDGDGDPSIDWDAAFDEVFPQDHVISIEITPPPGDWEALLAEWDLSVAKSYYEAAFTFDEQDLESVGFRLKGWSSLANGSGPGGGPIEGPSQPSGKFPLKVDFDRFGGPRFHDVNKLNLSNNWADLSYMRERLTDRIYLAMGVPAVRTAYARVRVDGHDNGLYTATQQVDRCFLEEHFGEAGGNGNLYKAVFINNDVGALTWQGSNATDYWSSSECPENFPECGLILKTNEDDPAMNDYGDLINFIDVLNHAPEAEFEAAIESVFDVDAFLRLSAVSVTLSSFDGYLGMGHNYYLYNRPDTGKFMMLPYDHNESYAGHPCGQNAINFDIHDPVCNQRGHEFILADRIFAVPAYKAQYLAYVQQLVDTVFTEEQHIAWITEFNDLIRTHIETDPNYIQSLAIFDRALGYEPPSGQNLGGHGGTEYNLMNFVVDRRAAVLSML
jgi:spore coat protein CotH